MCMIDKVKFIVAYLSGTLLYHSQHRHHSCLQRPVTLPFSVPSTTTPVSPPTGCSYNPPLLVTWPRVFKPISTTIVQSHRNTLTNLPLSWPTWATFSPDILWHIVEVREDVAAISSVRDGYVCLIMRWKRFRLKKYYQQKRICCSMRECDVADDDDDFLKWFKRKQ